jgi:sporulation protein YlmC with PRC-barrel domain
MERKIWICFLNDDYQKIDGFFLLVEETLSYVKIRAEGSNTIVTIPYHRILKIKEKINSEEKEDGKENI